MLILERREGERVIITTPEGRRIEVVFAQDRGRGRIALGFIADDGVIVDRAEIALEKQAAALPGDERSMSPDMHAE